MDEMVISRQSEYESKTYQENLNLGEFLADAKKHEEKKNVKRKTRKFGNYRCYDWKIKQKNFYERLRKLRC